MEGGWRVIWKEKTMGRRSRRMRRGTVGGNGGGVGTHGLRGSNARPSEVVSTTQTFSHMRGIESLRQARPNISSAKSSLTLCTTLLPAQHPWSQSQGTEKAVGTKVRTAQHPHQLQRFMYTHRHTATRLGAHRSANTAREAGAS